MRQKICTASIFVAMVGGLIAGCLINVPGAWWWDYRSYSPGVMTPVVVWVFMNIAVPVGVTALVVGGVVLGLWNLSSLICGKLRGSR